MSDPSRRWLLAAAPLALLAGPALAQERKTGPARQLFPYLDRYLGLPAAQRTRFRLGYYLRRDGEPASGLQGWIVHGGARTPIRVGASGAVSPLPTLAQWREGQVEFDAPPDTPFSINMRVEPSLAPAQSMPAAPLAEAVEQARTAIRRAAGVLSIAAPRLTRVVLIGAGASRAVLADGREVALPTTGDMASFTPADHPTARTIVCARRPRGMSIAPAD